MTRPQRYLERMCRRRFRRLSRTVPEAYRPWVARWLLRLLGTARVEIDEEETRRIAEITGLAHLKFKDFRRSTAVQAVAVRLAELDRQSVERTGPLSQNIDRIADLIGSSDLEKELLAFVVLSHTCSVLHDCLENVADQTKTSLTELLAVLLGVERTEIQTVLRDRGSLCAAGVLMVNPSETEVGGMLSLLDGLETALLDQADDVSHLFRRYFHVAAPARHSIEEFPHLRNDVALLLRLLRNACAEGTQGINVLIHGATGTGKTEFVKALASSVQAPLYEISHETEDSELDEQLVRFRSYLLCQRVLAKNSGSLIIFDEIEDLFPDTVVPLFGRTRGSGRYKAWTNATLESNPRPAFWLCNEMAQIDLAFRRRFTYTLEFRTPPRSVRRAMLKQRLVNMPVRPEWIERVAESANLTPALIEQVGRIASLAQHEDPATVEELAERTLRRSFEALDHSFDDLIGRAAPPLSYHPEWLNPSQDLTALIQGLKRKPKGRICFYGPPGTGKTAFAHYLAKQLDKELIQKTASDLLNCFVCQSSAEVDPFILM